MRDSSAPRTEATLSIGGSSLVVEVAGTLASQVRGLSHRDSLESGRGMLFTYPDNRVRSFWMKGMRFPLDVVWIADGVVVGMQENVPYESEDGEVVRFQSNTPAGMALEVNAGWIAEHGVQVGDSAILDTAAN
ncbi:MAG: DUF192 domain-containing protein [Parcubacteria group bacterium]|nr:DUF192 domain-containing protein [Parcubacteria group bacterium]